jgi:hexokinase
MTLPDLCSTFEPSFFLEDQKLKDIVEQFKKEMKEGLEDYGKDMAMVPSFVTGVPDGSEEGYVPFSFYVYDL